MESRFEIDSKLFCFRYPVALIAFAPVEIIGGRVVVTPDTQFVSSQNETGIVFVAAFTERLLAEQFLPKTGTTESVAMVEAFCPSEVSAILHLVAKQLRREVGISFDPTSAFGGFRVSLADFDRHSKV